MRRSCPARILDGLRRASLVVALLAMAAETSGQSLPARGPERLEGGEALPPERVIVNGPAHGASAFEIPIPDPHDAISLWNREWPRYDVEDVIDDE